jgi:hypothetical protein
MTRKTLKPHMRLGPSKTKLSSLGTELKKRYFLKVPEMSLTSTCAGTVF